MISHFVNRRSGFVYLVVHEMPALQDYLDTAAAIKADQYFGAESRWICDFQRCAPNGALNLQLLKFVTFLRDVNPHRARTALIADDDYMPAIGEYLESHGMASHVGLFCEQTHAYRWICEKKQRTSRFVA